MRILLAATILFICFTANAAGFTEKYVTGAGAGSHDGSDAANAFSWTEMVTDINAGSKGGTRYNYAGSIARTTGTDTISTGGLTNAPVVIRGYSSSIGDGYLGRTNGNNGLIPGNMPTVTYTTGGFSCTTTNVVMESISISGARSTALVTFSGNNSVVRACKIANAASGASATALTCSTASANITVIDCDIALSNGGNNGLAAVNYGATGTRFVGCRITSSNFGVQCTAAGVFFGNQIYNCTNIGITNNATGTGITCIGNTITGGSSDAIGILTSNSAVSYFLNNCITDNAGVGINFNSSVAFIAYNRTRDNSAAFSNNSDFITAQLWGEVTTDTGGAETDYVNVALTDYRLITTSPAKAAGLLPYTDIGGTQRLEPTGSGGGSYTFGQ